MDDRNHDTGRPPSPAPSIVSFRPSAHNPFLYRELVGRSFNNQNEAYMLPADREEQDRLNVQHEALKLTLDSLYAAPELVDIALAPRQSLQPAICDVGTGSGIWEVAIEMARQFPHADVVGIDLAPPIGLDPPSNCRFEVDDANLDFGHYSKAFDVVHLRGVGMGLKDYREAIHNMAQTLRPGGVLLLVSGEGQLYDRNKQPLPLVDEGHPQYSASQTAVSTSNACMGRRGINVFAANSWPEWLSSSPMWDNVGMEDIYIPVGPWMPNLDARCTHIAELMRLDVRHLLPALRGIMMEDGLPEARVDRLMNQMEEEMKTMKPPLFTRWRYAWATRTKARWEPNQQWT